MLLPARKVATPYVIDEDGHTREMVRHRYVGAGVHRRSNVPRHAAGPSRAGIVAMVVLAMMPLIVVLTMPIPGTISAKEPRERPARQDIGQATTAPGSPLRPSATASATPAASASPAKPSASPTPSRAHVRSPAPSPTAEAPNDPAPTGSPAASVCPPPDGLIPLPSVSAGPMKGLVNESSHPIRP